MQRRIEVPGAGAAERVAAHHAERERPEVGVAQGAAVRNKALGKRDIQAIEVVGHDLIFLLTL